MSDINRVCWSIGNLFVLALALLPVITMLLGTQWMIKGSYSTIATTTTTAKNELSLEVPTIFSVKPSVTFRVLFFCYLNYNV